MEFLGQPRFASMEFYDATVSTISGAADVKRFIEERPRIEEEAASYLLLARTHALDGVSSEFEPKYVTLEELQALYDRLRDRKAPRRLYNELITRAKLHRCPYCSDREPETLDHYLGKSAFSALAVLAVNLIPCCHPCNNKKNAYELSNRGKFAAALHPYFDDVSAISWLRARIVSDGVGPIARLYVDGAAIPDLALRATAHTHLQAFGLKRYFKIKSAQELTGLDERLPALLQKFGRSAVVDELTSQAVQRAGGRTNSWESALYNALAESDWYLDEHLTLLAGLPSTSTDPRRPIAL